MVKSRLGWWVLVLRFTEDEECAYVFWASLSSGNSGPVGSVLMICMRDSRPFREMFSCAVRKFCSSMSVAGWSGYIEDTAGIGHTCSDEFPSWASFAAQQGVDATASCSTVND
jgi:hypothetical protein